MSLVFSLLMASTSIFAAGRHGCGIRKTINIAEMTWLSARVLAHITETILADGYNCKTKLVPGDTVPTGTTMYTKGKPDIAPEFWVTSAAAVWEKMQESGKVYKAGKVFQSGAEESWYIPRYVAEANPGLKSYKDLPKYKDLFVEPTSNGKARIYGCFPGWNCEITNKNLFKALKLEDAGYELFDTGSADNLKASIARKVAQKKPILTYYWGPTDVLGKYGLVKLGMPEYNAENFKCLSDAKCADPKPSSWPSSEVAMVASVKMKRGKGVSKFLSKMSLPNDKMSEILAWADDNRAEPKEAAEHFFKNYEDIWTGWVSKKAAEQLKESFK